MAEKESVEEFIRNGNDLFTRQAASVEDIGKAGQEARGMVDGLGTVAQVRRFECVPCHFALRFRPGVLPEVG